MKKMKINSLIYLISFLVVMILTNSCEDYLERTPYSDIKEKDVFGTYHTFQGYVDDIYEYLIPYSQKTANYTLDCGDDCYGNHNNMCSKIIAEGRYQSVANSAPYNPFYSDLREGKGGEPGFWEGGWLGIHKVNLGLANINMLTNATPEEKNLLLGQMYFLRGWCHFEIARVWGGVPYIDFLLGPNDEMRIPRLSLENTLLKVASDFDLAAKHLPWDWDNTAQGQAAPGKNWGRISKGIALASKARVYLYAGSPWIKGLETGAENQYNLAFCDSAAKAALEVINSNIYELVPWDEYQNNFARNDNNGNTFIWTKEIIFSKIRPITNGKAEVDQCVGRLYLSKRTLAGTNANGRVNSPTLNFVNMYETANGLAIKDDPSYNTDNPWVNRDPRFLKTILIDGVKWSGKGMKIELFSEGGPNGAGLDMVPNVGGSVSGFLIRKYVNFGINGDDKNWNYFKLQVPYIRLAEMYLIYAEAVNEINGPSATLYGGPTAQEAVNIIRRRVKLPLNEDISLPYEFHTYGSTSFPDVNPIYTGSKEIFRERIRNERSIELAYEGHRWYDIRRWYVAHKPEYKSIWGLQFSKDHTRFNEFLIRDRVFENPKHYLFPFKKGDVNLYKDFQQNPGWE